MNLVTVVIWIVVGVAVAAVPALLHSRWKKQPAEPTATISVTMSVDASQLQQALARAGAAVAAKQDFDRSFDKLRRVTELSGDELEQLAEAYRSLGAGVRDKP